MNSPSFESTPNDSANYISQLETVMFTEVDPEEYEGIKATPNALDLLASERPIE
jgi:hypothetical protein